jgi:hypothetical protein
VAVLDVLQKIGGGFRGFFLEQFDAEIAGAGLELEHVRGLL